MSLPPKNIGRVKNVSTGYIPRSIQALLHNKLKRFNVLMCHRRFGKSVFAINEMIDQALRCNQMYPIYIYYAPTYSLVEDIAWAYLKQFLKDVPGVEWNQQKLRAKIDRPDRGDHIIIQLKSADSLTSAIGRYADGVVLDEYQDINPIFFNKLMPMLADRKGWMIILGTPRGDCDLTIKLNMFKSTAGWFTCKIKASESGVISQEELDIQRMSMLPEQYALEFECDETAAMIGSYYGSDVEKLIEGKRVGVYPHDPSFECETAWDLGMSDLNTIWIIQQIRGEVRVIDYISDNGKGLDHYVGLLYKKRYIYSRHYMPHDIRVRELGTGVTREQTLYNLGIPQGTIHVAEKMGVLDGINAVRMLLPRCTFDEPNTTEGLKCLRNYQRVHDAIKQTFSRTPLHNWASHGADAFRTLAVAIKPPMEQMRRNRLITQASADYNVFD